MLPDPSQIFRRYAYAWNRHDASAIVVTFAEGYSCTEPSIPGPLTGQAIRACANSLWSPFPDLSFETVSSINSSDDRLSAEWPMKRPGGCVIAMMAIACFVCLTAVNGQVRQQNSAMPSLQVSELQKQIKIEEAAHASAQKLATLWIALADASEEGDLQSAEDAFAHAIRLLRGTDAKDLYANALDGIATVYFATGRANTAEQCLRQAVELQRTAGDSTAEISTRRDLAVALIAERKYAEAEQQASEALHLSEAQTDPNVGETIVIYLTRSRAVCGMRRWSEALQDVDRAEALAVSKIGANSVELITIVALRGEEQFRSGSAEQGERTVQQALGLIDSRTDIPAPFQLRLRVRLLEEYSQLLGSAHRKREKKKVEEEIARTKAQQPGCNGCTVSAASLGLFP